MIPVFRYLRTRTGFLLILLLFGCIAVSPLSLAQFGSPPPLATDNGKPEGPTIGEVIASIAEKPSREPADFEHLAQMTLQIGQTALQQGQRIPDPSIWDGIHAVDAGAAIAPTHADWNNLRAELEKLLEEPPQQEDQEQQQEQNSDEQESENNEQADNQESSDQQNSEENGSQENSQQEKQEQNGSEQQQQNGNENGQQQERIGDMDDSAESPELDQERSQQAKQETREVGGEPTEQTPRSAKQAMTLQQLEQLKQQDKPGALHMLLQNAERSDKPADRKPQKDW